MSGREKVTRFRYFDSDLDDYIEGEKEEIVLDQIANYTGWIIIEFNSLEASIHYYLEQLLSQTEGRDEVVNFFLSDMTYQRKQNLLVKIYNHYVRSLENISHLKADLDKIEIKLIESGIRRNRYAHADFTIISKKKYVKVKTKSGKDGIRHIFVKFDQEDMESDLKFVRDTFEELENFDDKFIDSMTDADWEKYDEMLRNISLDIQS